MPYTQNYWQGENYNGDYIYTPELTKMIRRRLKEELPGCKFSVRGESFSGGRAIHVSLMRANFKVFSDGRTEGYEQVNYYYIDKANYLTDKAKEVLKRVTKIVQSYNYSDCDAQIDYFDVNFYFHLSVGRWDKPLVEIAGLKCKN